MSNENPTNPREVFDENEAGIAQKKQELTDAVAAGDYSKVAELAQEAKGMETAKAEMIGNAEDEAIETNKGIDEVKAAEEKVAREAVLAEVAKLDAENSQKEAAALLEKMQGGGTENSVEKTESQISEQESPIEPEIKPEVENGETVENPVDKLKIQYSDVLEEIKIVEKQEKKGELESEEFRELRKKREGIVLEFKKQYGYDESAAKEMSEKFNGRIGGTDADRMVINNYLGTELPIFAKDFKLEKYRDNYSKKEVFAVIHDNSQEGLGNQALLAKKQVELYQEAVEASKAIKEIPKDVIDKLTKEYRLELDALKDVEIRNERYSDEHFVEKNIETIFSPWVGAGDGKDAFMKPETEFYPDSSKLQELSGEKSAYAFRERGSRISNSIFNSLFYFKVAKEKGLIKE